MNSYIVLLRGINVGGHRKVFMAELRSVLSGLGLAEVRTYIQSGNVVFKSEERQTNILEKNIQKSIIDHFGFELTVLVKKRLELKEVFYNCPFPIEKKSIVILPY